jgi:4-amino-4-deoxy-L-arabinose transferase-like glycosyltransferase
MQGTQSPNRSFIAPTRWALALVLALLLGFGLAVRLFDLTDLPLDFHPTRQLFAALKARAMYYQTAPDIPDWKRDITIRQYETEATIEPPILESLVAATYRLTGEHLWIARIYSSLFWLLGGVFLFLLARNLLSLDGALVALAIYLFLPYAVIASRSFQPDPLMVMLVLLCLWSAVGWNRDGGWGWAVLAGLSGGAAVFVKFTAVFFVAAALLWAVLDRYSLKQALTKVQVWGMALLSILPAVGYLLYGLYFADTLGSQFSGRFFPGMWIDPFFYFRWEGKIALLLGHVGLVLALLGLMFLRSRRLQNLLLALWVAYFFFGMVFDFHISSHDYYSLPLIPIAALSLAGMGQEMLQGLAEAVSGSGWRQAAARLLLLFVVVMTVWDVRVQMKSVDYRPQEAYWASIGQALNHSASVIALTQDYGYPLVYWGFQKATIWPDYGDLQYRDRAGKSDFASRFQNLTRKKAYFLVTDFNEFQYQPELKDYLYGQYPIYLQGDGFVVFDLTHPLTP